VIASIRHKGLERFFYDGDQRAIPAAYRARIGRLMDRLDVCVKPQDMDLPGYKFHPLKGKREGTYAVTVSGNLRMTFQFADRNAVHLDLEDYH
jgi:proteic killer suppression protein